MDIEQLHPFKGEYESVKRTFIDPERVGDYHHDWHELYQEILKTAIQNE